MSLLEYRELVNELLALRKAKGSDLSDEVESHYAERLDDLWWSLTEDERERYEREPIS